MSAKAIAAVVGAVAAFAASALLAVLAADVLRTERALDHGDARFGTVAGTRGMWDADTLLPAETSRRLLDVDDDIGYREALQAFRLAEPRRAGRALRPARRPRGRRPSAGAGAAVAARSGIARRRC